MTHEQRIAIANLLVQMDLALCDEPMDPIRLAEIAVSLGNPVVKEWLSNEVAYEIQSDRSPLHPTPPPGG